MIIRVEAVLADPDGRLLLRLALILDDGQDHHVPGVVDGDELLPHLPGDVPPRGDEAGVEALVREGIEELLDQGLVADLDGAQEELLGGAGRPVDGEVLGVLAAFSGDEGLILVDQVQPLRLLDQPGLIVRVGD